MKTKLLRRALALLLLSTISSQLSTCFAQATAFTYQGGLNSGANPATGSYDLRFAIYDAVSAGAQQGSLVTNAATGVSNGLFTVTLDFGNVFPGANRWLEIAVRTNGAATFSLLTPRQQLTPVPHAIFATAASNVLGSVPLAQLPTSLVTNGATGVNITGTFSGNGAGMTNLNANVALLNGNPQTFTGTNVFNASVGIGTDSPGQSLQVGDGASSGSQGMIRLASRSSSVGANRTWDIGVPQTGEVLTNDGYSFVIKDTGVASSNAQFIIRWDNHFVGIGTNRPQQALHVVGSIRAEGGAAFAGNVGIGTNIPQQALHVVGNILASGTISGNGSGLSNVALLNASQTLTGTNIFSNSVVIVGQNTLQFGAGLTNQEVSAGKIGYEKFSTDSLDIVGAGTNGTSRKIKFWAEGGAAFTGNVGIGTTTPAQALDVAGNVRATGLLRLGSETNAAGSSYPDVGGILIRRVSSQGTNNNTVVARTDKMTLERDGSNGGLLVRWSSSPGPSVINAMGVTTAGVLVSFHAGVSAGAAAGSVTVFNNGQNVSHYDITFGDAFTPAHITHAVLDRYDSDFFMTGTITSTYNQ